MTPLKPLVKKNSSWKAKDSQKARRTQTTTKSSYEIHTRVWPMQAIRPQQKKLSTEEGNR